MPQIMTQAMQTETENRPESSPVLSDAAMWEAVLSRNLVLDGAFVYGVKSTGIYCRPSCSSRRPASRAAVDFFATADDADQAGFRSCLICAPHKSEPWQQDLNRVQRACRILEQGAADQSADVSLQGIADQLGDVSATHLQKSFKRILGITPRQYADAVRVRQFKAMLHQGDPVGQAAYAAGMKSPGTLYGRPAVGLGLSPSCYRAGAPGSVIQFAILPCPLGFYLLAATDEGICAVHIGSNIHELEAGLRAEFPQADITAAPETLAPYCLAVASGFGLDAEASAAARHLPLDIRGTAFQWRVWLALREMPPGKTSSYGEIAAALGTPRAARAVGSACGKNPVAMAIPCHRALRSDGSISGYRWGPAIKNAILAHERNMTDMELNDDVEKGSR